MDSGSVGHETDHTMERSEPFAALAGMNDRPFRHQLSNSSILDKNSITLHTNPGIPSIPQQAEASQKACMLLSCEEKSECKRTKQSTRRRNHNLCSYNFTDKRETRRPANTQKEESRNIAGEGAGSIAADQKTDHACACMENIQPIPGNEQEVHMVTWRPQSGQQEKNGEVCT